MNQPPNTSKSIAIASGKGGTGKTTVAVSLSAAIAKSRPVTLADCDVEEPNSHLLRGVSALSSVEARVASVQFDSEHCLSCGLCVKACRFNAIAVLKTGPMFFQELCHGCMGCVLACPNDACTETTRRVGDIRKDVSGKDTLVDGILDVGQPMATGLIEQVRQTCTLEHLTILDAPPGVRCDMLATIRDCDYVVLVTEPTPFGLHDLRLAVRALRGMGNDFGVLVNRYEPEQEWVEQFCQTEQIDILARIPESRAVAECYSRGTVPYGQVESFTLAIDTLIGQLEQRGLV